jgi:hypothetical protein
MSGLRPAAAWTFAVQSLWSNAASNHTGGCMISYP